MALKAGYVGIKNRIKWKINKLASMLPADIPEGDKLALNSQIDSIWSANARTGVHQLLPLNISTLKSLNTTGTWSGNAYTKDGVTFTCTVDSNGNVTEIATSGTSSAEWVTFEFIHVLSIAKGDYKLSGISGGAANTYRFSVAGSVVTDFPLYDGEQAFEISADGTVSVSLIVRQSSVDMSGKTFKPLIRLAQDTDTSFTSYAMTNFELTEYCIKHKSYDFTYTTSTEVGNVQNVDVSLDVDKSKIVSAWIDIGGTNDEASCSFITDGSNYAKVFVRNVFGHSSATSISGVLHILYKDYISTPITRATDISEVQEEEPATKKKATKSRKEGE